MDTDADILEWQWQLAGWIPMWKREPAVTAIRRIAQRELCASDSESHLDSDLKVTFFASGLLNKLYKVELGGSDTVYLIRIPLPVDPWFKTQSEVYTIKTIQGLTNLPLPTIQAYCADSHNDLHLEWLLMKMLPGQPLWDLWRSLSMQQKEDVIKKLARLHVDLFNARWSAVGSLGTSGASLHSDGTAKLSRKDTIHETTGHLGSGMTPLSNSSDQNTRKFYSTQQTHNDSLFPLGPIVQQAFSLASRVKVQAERGPFFSDYDWMHAWLTVLLRTHEQELNLSDDEDVREDAETYARVAKELLDILPMVFHPEESTSTCIVHDDLNFNNILIDEVGNITGVIDWECVSALPLWRACQLPKLLAGATRDEMPDPAVYADADDEDMERLREYGMPMSDNLGKNSLYWEHVLEWETKVLIVTFMAEMDHLAPEWRRVNESSKLKMEFVESVESVAACIDEEGVLTWIQDFKDGLITHE